MSQIILTKTPSVVLPAGISVVDNTITIKKNQAFKETVTIKVIDRAVTDFNLVIEENSEIKIILDIEDSFNDEINYNINLVTRPNTNVKFLLIADIHSNNAILNFKGDSYKDSNIDFIGSFISNVITAKIHLDLLGEGANLNVKTITVSAKDNNQKLDIHMIHHAPYTIADMTNIGIAGENGIVRLNGVGEILQGMKHSNAFQTLKGIITNDLAEIDVNPILIIDEYDIKAGHAATVGKIEEEVLFYLMSRGLNQLESERLVINGMLRPVIDEIDDEELRDNVLTMVNGRI